jgi:hypothetical protein
VCSSQSWQIAPSARRSTPSGELGGGRLRRRAAGDRAAGRVGDVVGERGALGPSGSGGSALIQSAPAPGRIAAQQLLQRGLGLHLVQLEVKLWVRCRQASSRQGDPHRGGERRRQAGRRPPDAARQLRLGQEKHRERAPGMQQRTLAAS